MRTLRTRPSRSRRELRIAAVIACALWLLGVELAPGLHVALHARLARHVHDAEPGPVVTVHFDDAWHAHGGSAHSHGFTPPLDDPDPISSGFHAPVPFDPGHAGHSLAHRALALASPPIVQTAPLQVPRAILPVTHRIARLSAAIPPPDPSARAPPSRSIAT